MNEIYEFLKDCGTYYLATIEGDKPRVRPFGTVNIYDNKLYIQTGKSKKVYKQIEANGNVEICAFKDGKWIRVSGCLANDDRIEAKKAMLDNYPELRNMYDENDTNTSVLFFTNLEATIYSFTEEPKTIKID